MPRRLIVHAGFHKTGTTSVQRLLDRSRDALDPLKVVLRADMKALCEAARAFSVSRTTVDLGLIKYEAAILAEQWRADTVLLSSEDLSGQMPGRHGLKRYDAAPVIAAAMLEAWQEALPGIEVCFVFTSRDAAAWLASCYVQHLRATRIAITADHYMREYSASAELPAIIARVQAAVPDADVRNIALEGTEDKRLGPADALLALAGVPADVRSTIGPIGRANPSMTRKRQAAFLALNRSHLSDKEVHARKLHMP